MQMRHLSALRGVDHEVGSGDLSVRGVGKSCRGKILVYVSVLVPGICRVHYCNSVSCEFDGSGLYSALQVA